LHARAFGLGVAPGVRKGYGCGGMGERAMRGIAGRWGRGNGET
jgi:hypothetical protein